VETKEEAEGECDGKKKRANDQFDAKKRVGGRSAIGVKRRNKKNCQIDNSKKQILRVWGGDS